MFGSHSRWVLGFTAAAVVALAGCGGSSSTSAGGSCTTASGKTTKIALLAPVTGSVAADGQEYKRGAQMAIDEINAAGGAAGYKLELVVGDTGDLSSDQVASAIQRLAGDSDVNIFMTGYADLTNFEINTMAQMGYPYLVTGNASQTKAIISKNPSKYVGIYSLSPDYAVYGTAYPAWIKSLADSGKFTPRKKSFFTVTSDNPYSKDIAQGMTANFTQLGWKLAGNETTPTQDIRDWTSVISKIQAADPDVVINTDFTPGNEASFLSQFLQNPTKSILYLDYAPALPEFIPLTGDKSTGITSAVAGAPVNTLPRTQEIKSKFKAKYGVETGKYGVALYESVYLYRDALAKVCDPSKRKAIGQAIGAADKDIAMGHLRFDPNTHLAQTGPNAYPFPIYQIWNRQLHIVSPDPYTDAQFQLPPWIK